jgi:anti-sigma factor RsiW
MNTTTHPFAPEEVMAFVDGELSTEQTQAVSSHIGQCAECATVAANHRGLSEQMTSWRVGLAPARLADQFLAGTGEEVSRLGVLKRRRSPVFRYAIGVASGLAALVLLLAISIPNLLRSKMAANEASQIARQRAEDTSKITALYSSVPSAGPRSGHGERADKGESDEEKALIHSPRLGLALAAPMIARTVSLSIAVKEFDAARVSLDAILARHNGYAAELNVATPQGAARTIQASLRIPAPQLVAAVAELKALGRVENETQGGEEVTQQQADLVARLKNSRETEQRLQDVLRTRTGKVKDVLEVEEEIARVRGEIEEMEAEQQTLEHRVTFATVDLKLGEEYKAQLTTPAPSVGIQLRNATVNGFRSALEGLLALVLFLAESVPTLLLWLAILGFPAWLLWRRYRRALAAGLPLGV